MLRKNEERTDIVSCIGINGEGVIKTEDGTVFVPYALPGEKVRYRVLKVTSKCAYGKALEILTPAEERVRPKCLVFAKCGGCNLQHLKYTEQLVVKSNSVAVCFKKIAGIDVEIKPAVRGDNEFRYRNKLQLPVGDGEDGPQIGFYAENSHRIIEIDDCLINALWTENLIKAFKSYMLQAGLKGYNEQTLSGDVREITAKEIKDKLIIVVVSTKRNLPRLDLLTELLKQEIKMKFSLFINYNPKPTNVIYGEEFFCVCGQKSYSSEMLGVKYDTGVMSFMQVNRSVCSKLYSAVSQAVAADENSTVIDAYSGAGVLTAILAKKAKKVIGIEIVKEAVNIADSVAKKNKLSDKITNYCASCEEILPSIVARERANGAKITVVLDPPRKGCDIRVIRSLIKNDIDKIVYVSCKPSTLARDVGLLVGTLQEENGEIKRSNNFQPRYKIDEIKTYDMFAQTKHVETVVLLSRKKAKDYLEVNVEMDDDFLTKAESKGTYDQIKQYILDKYQIKVSSLYIAQVKEMCGIKERDNYNHSKKEDSKQPQVPEDKRQIIMEALQYFKMI